MTRARSNVEDAIQRAVIHWTRETYPTTRIFAIRNEDMRLRQGELELGHPDLQLEATAADYIECILKLELKRKKGKLSPVQTSWNTKFDEVYRKNCQRAVAYGFDEAKDLIVRWHMTLL